MARGDHAEQLSRVRIDDLAMFVDIAEAGSIAAAARRLGVPKSTLGRTLSRIEHELGVVLLRRMARGPGLTEQGRALANVAAPHVAALRDVASSVGLKVAEPYGTLRVTAPNDIARLVLGPLAAAFIARYPRVKVDVDVTMRMVDLVAEGLDAAIRVSQKALPSSSLVAKKLARLDLGLYASPQYVARRGMPRKPEDLARHEHVLFGRSGRALSLSGPEGNVKVTLEGRLVGNDFFFLQEAIAAGAGIGSLPRFVAEHDVVQGRLVRVVPDYCLGGATAYLIHPPARPLPTKLEAFRSFALEHAPRLLSAPAP